MPNSKNIEELKVIEEKKGKAKSVFFAHYRGMTVNQITALRHKIRTAGGDMLVAKNTLLRIAFADQQLSERLIGPTATIFSYEDEIAPIKAITAFQKDNELPTITAGYLDGKALTDTEVIALSKLPGKPELRAKVVGSLAAPLSGIVNVLHGNLRGLVYALKAIHDQKVSVH